MTIILIIRSIQGFEQTPIHALLFFIQHWVISTTDCDCVHLASWVFETVRGKVIGLNPHENDEIYKNFAINKCRSMHSRISCWCFHSSCVRPPYLRWCSATYCARDACSSNWLSLSNAEANEQSGCGGLVMQIRLKTPFSAAVSELQSLLYAAKQLSKSGILLQIENTIIGTGLLSVTFLPIIIYNAYFRILN